jgi:hypothetical protein
MSTVTATPAPSGSAEAAVFPAMNAHDRCDKCGAQGYVRWAKGKVDLVLCGHHTTENEPELIAAGFSIHEDNRDLLTQRPVAAY